MDDSADRAVIRLSPEAAEAFSAALDAPAEMNERLASWLPGALPPVPGLGDPLGPRPGPPGATSQPSSTARQTEGSTCECLPTSSAAAAELLRVEPGTVAKWRQRGLFPAPDWPVEETGRALWRRATVEAWALRTGRGR